MQETVYTPISSQENINTQTNTAKIGWENLALLYGKRIIASCAAVDNGESAVAYTVPTGKIFMLLTATLTVANHDTTRTTNYAAIVGATGAFSSFPDTTNILRLSVDTFDTGTLAICPTIPLICLPGERIGCFNTQTDATTTFNITGYEIDAALYNNLL